MAKATKKDKDDAAVEKIAEGLSPEDRRSEDRPVEQPIPANECRSCHRDSASLRKVCSVCGYSEPSERA